MTAQTSTDSTNQLWQTTVKPYLSAPLWQKSLSYNAGHYLMVPLHAAFVLNNKEWQQDFADHFARFADTGYTQMGTTHLYRIQYYYLVSQFLVLCAEHKADSLLPKNLYQLIYNRVNKTWNQDEIWQWKYPKNKITTFKNMRAKILWKLYTQEIEEFTYHRVIVDEELFTMAVAADLKRYLDLKNLPPNNVLDDITQVATEVFHKRVKWNADGGWLFQPVYWHNFEDFAYAGNDSLAENLSPKEVADVAEDVSHSLRMPLWINSFLAATTPYHSNHDFFLRLKKGLDIQLFNTILIPPDSSRNYYLANNFMDGKNGVYRYHYSNRPGGIGPYELTGHLTIGWWSFLETARSKSLYETLTSNYPLEEGKVVPYYQKSVHSKPVIVGKVEANQLMKLICRLAVQLPTHS
jgi:hypothetical protein